MKKKVFIDGRAGTTGLRIEERLSGRDDIEMISLPDELRKDPDARRRMLNEADIVFLCLPDAAATEAVGMIENSNTVAYGLPELDGSFEEKIRGSKRIAVPGCHASGFIALIYPLIKCDILDKGAKLSAFSITGYSGGGKAMIADYEADELDPYLTAPRQYGITQMHKHLPEMVKITGLDTAPIFSPIVSSFYSGMEVTVPLFKSQLKCGGIEEIKAVYKSLYNDEIIYYKECDESGFLSAAALSGKDSMQIEVRGNEERILLVARYDNLGKGASGAAVEMLNIKLGCNKSEGLEV